MQPLPLACHLSCGVGASQIGAGRALWFGLFVLIMVTQNSSIANASKLIVQTNSGAVQGVNVGSVNQWRGIPYAAPPVGNLRWRPPIPPAPWAGIRDASAFGSQCIQLDLSKGFYGGRIIDQSFVKTMDAENYAIVNTIIGLAHNLDLKVVAEGVETKKQRQLLALAACGLAQGHLFAEPMRAESVGAFIEKNRRNSGRPQKSGLARGAARM